MRAILLYQQGKITALYLGILLPAATAVAATFIAQSSFADSSGISPVVIGIMLGILLGNLLPSVISDRIKSGTAFAAKYILRTAIIFYGFRLTFQNIVEVGTPGLFVSVIMVVSTLLIGYYLGKKNIRYGCGYRAAHGCRKCHLRGCSRMRH